MKKSPVKSFIQDVGVLVLGASSLFVFAGAFIVYSETGSFYFDWETVKYSIVDNIPVLLFALLLMAVALFAVVNYFLWAMAQRKNCQIQYVDLAQIAPIWLEYNEVENNIREKITAETAQTEGDKGQERVLTNVLATRALEFETQRVRDFVKNILIPNADKFDEYETGMMIDLLHMLESNRDLTSVATLCSKDPERQMYSDKAATLDGKTMYQILGEFTLLDHTIRVAEIMVAMHEKNTDRLTVGPLFSRVVITAISHDIGKIIVKNSTLRITGEMYHKTPHEHISVMMLQEMYPEYKHSKSVADAIRSHHLGKVEGTLPQLLKDADKKAREVEFGEWRIRNKNAVASNAQTTSTSVENEAKDEPITAEQSAPETVPFEDFGDDAAAEHAEPSDPEEPISTPSAESRPKKKQIKDDAVVAAPKDDEPDFDYLEAKGEALARELHGGINNIAAGTAFNRQKILGVSFGDMVIFEYIFFKNAIEKTIGRRIDNKVFSNIVDQLKAAGVVKLIDTEKGFFVSRFILEFPTRKDEGNFIPVAGEFFGLSADELEESKRLNPVLRGVNVRPYKNSEKAN